MEGKPEMEHKIEEVRGAEAARQGTVASPQKRGPSILYIRTYVWRWGSQVVALPKPWPHIFGWLDSSSAVIFQSSFRKDHSPVIVSVEIRPIIIVKKENDKEYFRTGFLILKHDEEWKPIEELENLARKAKEIFKVKDEVMDKVCKAKLLLIEP